MKFSQLLKIYSTHLLKLLVSVIISIKTLNFLIDFINVDYRIPCIQIYALGLLYQKLSSKNKHQFTKFYKVLTKGVILLKYYIK